MNYENLHLYRHLNCARAKVPSLVHCMFDILTATCGSLFQLTRRKKPGQESEEEGVTRFIYQDKDIPFCLPNSTGGVVEMGWKCYCSLCLYDSNWFICHCAKCLPSHAFTHVPQRQNCPFVHIKPNDNFRTYINGRLVKNGWAYQLQKLEEKCCCIFHNCPNTSTNDEPCLCPRCVLDFHCDCITCGGKCAECGDCCDVDKARREVECKHAKCESFTAEEFWETVGINTPTQNEE